MRCIAKIQLQREAGPLAEVKAMDIASVPLDEFLACGPVDEPPIAGEMPRGCAVPDGMGNSLPVLAEANGYRIVAIVAGDVAAIDEAGMEAGYYTSDSLTVHGEHRGKGLSVALALWAHVGRRGPPATRKLSAGGRKALTAAWQVARGERESAWWPSPGSDGAD